MDNKTEFDYPQEWTKKAIDKNGYYKLNDMHKIYNDPNRSLIGQEQTDPPIYNADGFIVSKDGVSCFDGPKEYEVGKTKYTVYSVYPNVPHKKYKQDLYHEILPKLVEMFLKHKELK